MRLPFPESLAPENRALLRDFAVLGGIASLGLLIAYILLARWTPPFPRDGSSLVVGRDFLNFWMYGRAALSHAPQNFYDPHLYNAVLRTMLGNDYLGQNWSYPPHIMLFATPFGLLPYLGALLCWTGGSVAIFAKSGIARLHEPAMLLPLLAAPAVAFCLISGQSSLVTAAMLVTIFAWLDRRPIGAGVLIGLLTLKPQLGFLFPVILIASNRWRVFAVASVTAMMLFAVTTVLFGLDVWEQYLRLGLPVQNAVLEDPRLIAAPFIPTVFMNLHAAGLAYGPAMTLQGCVSLLAVATVFWAFRTHRDVNPQILQALFFACSIAATPYLLSYDTLPLVFAAVMLLANTSVDATGRNLIKLVFWLPFLQYIFGKFHIPAPAFIAPAVAVWIAMRLTSKLQVAGPTATAA